MICLGCFGGSALLSSGILLNPLLPFPEITCPLRGSYFLVSPSSFLSLPVGTFLSSITFVSTFVFGMLSITKALWFNVLIDKSTSDWVAFLSKRSAWTFVNSFFASSITDDVLSVTSAFTIAACIRLITTNNLLVSAFSISSVWLVGFTALSDTLSSFLSWALKSALSSLLEVSSSVLDLSWRTCSVRDWTRIICLVSASSEMSFPLSKRWFSSLNWESWLAKLNKLSSSAFAIAAWSSLIAWMRGDLSTGFWATGVLSPSTSSFDFSIGFSLGGTPSVGSVTPVLTVAGDTGKVSALTAPLAKNINAATATLAAPKWYLRIE